MEYNHNSLMRLLIIGKIMAPTLALHKWTSRKDKIRTCMKVRLMICMYEFYECILSDISMSRHELSVCVWLALIASKWVYLVYVGAWDFIRTLYK